MKEAGMEGMRNFIEVDNHCALEVGHLKEGTRTFEVRRPKFKRGALRCQSRKVPRN